MEVFSQVAQPSTSIIYCLRLRAIFWFLCIASAVCGLILVLSGFSPLLSTTHELMPIHSSFLPETLRALVGDGSYIPSAIYRPLLPIIGRHRLAVEDFEKPPKKQFANPLLLLTYPDVVVILTFNGIVYSVYYG